MADDYLGQLENLADETVSLRAETASQKREIAQLRATIAEKDAEIERLKVWRDVITDRLVCDWTLDSENVDDPVKAVQQMVATYISEAADPAISKQAAELARLRALLDSLPTTHLNDEWLDKIEQAAKGGEA